MLPGGTLAWLQVAAVVAVAVLTKEYLSLRRLLQDARLSGICESCPEQQHISIASRHASSRLEKVVHRQQQQQAAEEGKPGSAVDVIRREGSSVWCHGENYNDRMCRFRNLCYLPGPSVYVFFHHTSASVLSGLPDDRFSPALADLSTLRDHNRQQFNYVDVPADRVVQVLGGEAVLVNHTSLIMKRFNPDNLMHVLHDDLLPLYSTLSMHEAGGRTENTTSSSGFNTNSFNTFNTQLVFMEGWEPGPYVDLYELFSAYKPLFVKDIETANKAVCFRDVYVGLSKHTTWYQYGFHMPQGPIMDSQVTSIEIRQFTQFIQDRYGVNDGLKKQSDDGDVKSNNGDVKSNNGNVKSNDGDEKSKNEDVKSNTGDAKSNNGDVKSNNGNVKSNAAVGDQKAMVVFTRRYNRLILNEVALTTALAQRLQMKVLTLSMETHTIPEIIAVLQTTTVLISIHGSLLSLAMFLKPGAVLVELFPYAINPNHYTPYKTLAELPGMGIMYRSWRNTHKQNTITHPDRGWDTGGIAHLPLEEQQRIQTSQEVPLHHCCRDPEWLFRIYQDTVVDIDEVVGIVQHQLLERDIKLPGLVEEQHALVCDRMFPSWVRDITCTKLSSESVKLSDKSLKLSDESPKVVGFDVRWKAPWNIEFLEAETVQYEVWLQEKGHDDYSAFIMTKTEHRFDSGLKEGVEYYVWVKCLLDSNIIGPLNTEQVVCVS